MTLTTLRQELRLVSKDKDFRHGDHQKVADALKISRVYLWQFRNKKVKFYDTVEHRKLVINATAEYRKLKRERVRELEEFERQNS